MSKRQKLFSRTLTSAKDIAQARGEAEGLHYIRLTSTIAPELYRFQHSDHGSSTAKVVIESEYLHLGGRMDEAGQRELAREIAAMHRPLDAQALSNDSEKRKAVGLPTLTDEQAAGLGRKYGFPVPTHCGATEQDNTWEEDWATFYRDRRLGDLVRRIGDKGVQGEWDKMRNK